MQVIKTISGIKKFSRDVHAAGKTIGFVPTMGYLHSGHMSLVNAAREECGIVIVSIFVNPIQFGPSEDLAGYPRDIENDKKVLEEAGVDLLFCPDDDEMYGNGFSTHVEVTGVLTENLCGRSRPGHFKGVTTVVAKLFNIISPDISYFGQKDIQQAMIVGKMAGDLNFSTRISVMPVIREEDGLAMSSRNSYLSAEERSQAVQLYRSLEKARSMVEKGEKSSELIKKSAREFLKGFDMINIDYLEIVDSERLQPVVTIENDVYVAIAAFLGSTRLIDNIKVSI